MKFELNTHPGLIINNPTIEIYYVVDYPQHKTFAPTIIFIDGDSPKIRIGHVMSQQPYVNDTWTDEDVENAINKYLNEIQIID